MGKSEREYLAITKYLHDEAYSPLKEFHTCTDFPHFHSLSFTHYVWRAICHKICSQAGRRLLFGVAIQWESTHNDIHSNYDEISKIMIWEKLTCYIRHWIMNSWCCNCPSCLKEHGYKDTHLRILLDSYYLNSFLNNCKSLRNIFK